MQGVSFGYCSTARHSIAPLHIVERYINMKPANEVTKAQLTVREL